MRISVDDEIEEYPALLALITRANKIVRDIMGESAVEFTAAWRLVKGPPERPVIELRLIYPLAKTAEMFTVTELANTKRLDRQISHLWSDFLGIITRIHSARLKGMIAELDEE
jgi:hypothetical protein